METVELLLWFLWQLPQNIVALFIYPFLGKKELIKYENNTWYFKAEKMQGAISLGCFVYLSKTHAKHESTIRHEMGHTVQSRILGWLYLFIIGIPSILWAWLGDDDECYYSFYPESWANKLGGVGVRYYKGKCYPILLD